MIFTAAAAAASENVNFACRVFVAGWILFAVLGGPGRQGVLKIKHIKRTERSIISCWSFFSSEETATEPVLRTVPSGVRVPEINEALIYHEMWVAEGRKGVGENIQTTKHYHQTSEPIANEHGEGRGMGQWIAHLASKQTRNKFLYHGNLWLKCLLLTHFICFNYIGKGVWCIKLSTVFFIGGLVRLILVCVKKMQLKLIVLTKSDTCRPSLIELQYLPSYCCMFLTPGLPTATDHGDRV